MSTTCKRSNSGVLTHRRRSRIEILLLLITPILGIVASCVRSEPKIPASDVLPKQEAAIKTPPPPPPLPWDLEPPWLDDQTGLISRDVIIKICTRSCITPDAIVTLWSTAGGEPKYLDLSPTGSSCTHYYGSFYDTSGTEIHLDRLGPNSFGTLVRNLKKTSERRCGPGARITK